MPVVHFKVRLAIPAIAGKTSFGRLNSNIRCIEMEEMKLEYDDYVS